MEFFSDVLDGYMKKYGMTAGRLAKQANVAKQTIASWQEGRVKRPRNVDTILQVARALRLPIDEANHLLHSARHDSLDLLKQSGNEKLSAILEYWETTENVLAIPTTHTPFQAPSAIGDFIGRKSTIDTISTALQQGGSICILQGMGGVGKTTVANRLAYQLKSHFSDGVLWAELGNRELTDDYLMLILRDFAKAYGVDVRDDTDLTSRSRTVRDLLSAKKTLVILDNARGTNAVRHLLPPSLGSCSVLITTRNRKMLGDRATSFDINSFTVEDSLAFLRNVVGQQRIAEEEDGAREIIDFVGGLPLALRVVGGALVEADSLTLKEYCDELRDEHSRLELLMDWEDVSKNVRASFEVSFNRLGQPLQQLLTQLAVFAGYDFSVEAVAALTQQSVVTLKRHLGRFQALSLLERSESATSRPSKPYLVRYRFHPLLRAFVREKLHLPALDLQARLATYFAEYANLHGQENYDALDLDWENIRASVHWSQENSWETPLLNAIEGLTNYSIGMAGFLDARGHWREAQQFLAWGMAADTVQKEPLQHAWYQLKRGTFASYLADHTTAADALHRSLQLTADAQINEEVALCRASCYELLAQISLRQGIEDALDWSEKGISLLRQVKSAETIHLLGYMLTRQSTILGKIGDLPAAQRVIEQGLAMLPPRPTPARASGELNLGNLAYLKGDLTTAKDHWAKAADEAERLGDNRRVADIWQNTAIAFSSVGDFVQSLAFYDKAITVYRNSGDINGECRALSNSADDLRKIGRIAEATDRLDTAIVKANHHQQESELYALYNRALLQTYVGQLSTAVEDLDHAEQLSRQSRRLRWLGMITMVRAEIAYLNEQWEEAHHLIDSALQSGLDEEEKGVALRIKGDILAALQQGDTADVAYAESVAILATTNHFEHTRSLLAQIKRLQAEYTTDSQLRSILQAFQAMQTPREINQVEQLLNRDQKTP